MPIPALRAAQTTNTTGTGTLVLNASPVGRRNFLAAFGAGSSRIHYVIQGTTFFEIGLGDFDGGTPGNLTHVTVLTSSNSNALVSLPVGVADVFTFIDPAARVVLTGTGAITAALADVGNLVHWSGTSAAAFNFPAIATVPPGQGYLVANLGTATLTLDPNAAELINGAATLAILPGESADCYRSGAAWVAVVAAPGVPAGTVAMFAGATAPATYRFCDGALVSRTTFAPLFAAIGTAWGAGDGSTTFALPDLRGRVPIGVGTGSGLTARALAASGGAETHTMTTAEMPAHTHPLIGNAIQGGADFTPSATTDTNSRPSAFVTNSTGGGGAHNNMQPFNGINFIIKT